MDIVDALKQEEAKLQKQLAGIQSAIAALNGGGTRVVSPGHASSPNGAAAPKRTMSAAVRARISKTAKARWAKIRAEKAKKAK
jgi:hypothetical protein